MTASSSSNSQGRYLTVDELIGMHNERDLLALARVGGFNSTTGASINRDRLQAQIDRAQSVIDGHVLARFPHLANLASSAMPPSLKGIASDLAIYWLRDRVGDAGGVDDVVRNRYLDAMKSLESIRDGKTDLGSGLTGLSGGDGQTDRIQGAFPAPHAPSLLEGYR